MELAAKRPTKKIRPQVGPQEDFLRNPADIVVYGGAAGSGKTHAILLECVRHKNVPNFSAVIFRRNSTQVRNPGGLWDTSGEIYTHLGGTPKETVLEWDFPSGAKIKFAHLEHDKTRFDWQGSQITLICFDELTHFSWTQFIYMLSRNRSTCGVKPYIRATTNPDSQSWLRPFIDWWIGPNGYPIPERSGKIRYFSIINNKVEWASSKEEFMRRFPDVEPKSFSFIAATIQDNQILLEKNPEYLASLKALPQYEREQLLHGNWNISPAAGNFFKRSYFEIVTAVPKKTKKVRYWDRAATKKNETNDPDYTVGIKLEKDDDGILYITDMVRVQESPLGVQKAIKNTASLDGPLVKIGIEEDPGQAGKVDTDLLIRMLQGYVAKAYRVGKDKITRASPVSAQAEAGNIKILAAKWNQDFLEELENFPEGSHDDIVDALSGAFQMLTKPTYDIRAITGYKG